VDESLSLAKQVPIWAFHGEKDTTIPLARIQELMAALSTARGSAIYTIIPKVGHFDAKAKGSPKKTTSLDVRATPGQAGCCLRQDCGSLG
jgi:dienelactone hydrolase